MRHIKLLVCAFLSIAAAGYAQNVSGHQYSYDYQMIRLDSSYDAKADRKMAKYITLKRKKLDKVMSVVIAECEAELESYAPESPLSNLLTDILLNESPKYATDTAFANTDLSMLNFGGIRTSMPAGEVTVGDIYNISPFDNYLTFILLKGSELRKALGRFTDKFNAPYSGAVITYNNGKVTDVTVQGKPIDDNKIYKLITLNFISDGGDHLLEGIRYEKIEYSTSTFRDFLISELISMKEKGIKIRSGIDGRVKRN